MKASSIASFFKFFRSLPIFEKLTIEENLEFDTLYQAYHDFLKILHKKLNEDNP